MDKASCSIFGDKSMNRFAQVSRNSQASILRRSWKPRSIQAASQSVPWTPVTPWLSVPLLKPYQFSRDERQEQPRRRQGLRRLSVQRYAFYTHTERERASPTCPSFLVHIQADRPCVTKQWTDPSDPKPRKWADLLTRTGRWGSSSKKTGRSAGPLKARPKRRKERNRARSMPREWSGNNSPVSLENRANSKCYFYAKLTHTRS